MFNRLMMKRSIVEHKKSYCNILLIFIISFSFLCFTQVFSDSMNNYWRAVAVPNIEKDFTCDIQIKNISEEDAAIFEDIPNVWTSYENGHLDFFLKDNKAFDVTIEKIREQFNEKLEHHYNGWSEETSPMLFVYYGIDAESLIDERDPSENPDNFADVIQVLMSIVAAVAMILIYRNYFVQRAADIRILSALGMSPVQMFFLFFAEFNVLVLLSMAAGFAIGISLVFLLCQLCTLTDMSVTTMVYPVFFVNSNKILVTALNGYIAVLIAFLFVYEKVKLQSTSQPERVQRLDFNPNWFRSTYRKIRGDFYSFYTSVLTRRSSVLSRIGQATLSCFILIFSVTFVWIWQFSLTDPYKDDSLASTLASLPQMLFLIGVVVYAFLYGMIVNAAFIRERMVASMQEIRSLHEIGADEECLFACFQRYVRKKAFFAIVVGIVGGTLFAEFLYHAEGYQMTATVGAILEIFTICILYYSVYYLAVKRFFKSHHQELFSGERSSTHGFN